jgi:hypothetical protein
VVYGTEEVGKIFLTRAFSEKPMELTSLDDIWQGIPPEEKLEMMSAAHANGTGWVMAVIVLGGTLAVGLQVEWLLWGSMLMAPMIFQAAAGRTWRAARPISVLEYLAARTAARRYAFVVKSEDLYCRMIFRGVLEKIVEDPDEQYEDLFETTMRNNKKEVWVALFGDAVVIMSERWGGAELEFGHLLNEKLLIESNSAEIGTDYSRDKEVFLEYEDRDSGKRRVRVTSRHPAALIVFEKKAREIQTALTAGAALLNQFTDEDFDEFGEGGAAAA